MPVQRKHNLARIDQHSVAPCSFVAVCGLLAGVAANKGNVRGPLVAVKRLRQKSAQSKVPLSSYNRQCRKKCQENIKKSLHTAEKRQLVLPIYQKPKLCCFYGTTANQKVALFQVSFTAIWLSLLSRFQKNIQINDVLVWPNSLVIFINLYHHSGNHIIWVLHFGKMIFILVIFFAFTLQDHQWWRYHRRLLDYQSPYFQSISPM